MVLGIYSSKYQLIANYYNEITKDKVFLIPENFETMINNYVFVTEFTSKPKDKDDSITNQGTAFYVKELGIISCLHNFWDITATLDNEKLNSNISHTTIFLPRHPIKYYVKVKKVFFEQDIIILEIPFFNAQGGFELANKNINFTPQRSIYSAVGYPDYSEKSSNISIVNNIRITQERIIRDQNICVIDKQFYAGASGGPVFDKNNKVVGIISRGNEYGKNTEHYNAFTPIKPILEYTEK